MKFFISLLTIILCITLVGCGDFGDPTISVGGDDITQTNSSDITSSGEEQEEGDTVFDLNSYELKLVNPWNAIPEGFSPELALIKKDYAGFEDAQFDARAIEQLHAMCDAAKLSNVDLIIISAYRTNEFQTFNFNRKVKRLMDADNSLTLEQAEKEAEKVVARPGTSEHQLGLAVDFNSVEDSFRTTLEYSWLVNNCADYGFILRYTEEFRDKTGIIPEPWHYRYVGVEAAKIIMTEGISFEEFVERYKPAE